jgi:NAD+-dependent protein deacetylase SIR2
MFRALKEKYGLKGSGKELFDASVYSNDDSTAAFHSMVQSLHHLMTTAQPTPFHRLLAGLADGGRLLRHYTQNVDGLDTSMSSLATRIPLDSAIPWPRTVQLHGSLTKMVCQKCNIISDFEPARFNGSQAPLCDVCTENDAVRAAAGKRIHGVGKLRPRILLYNEHNPDEETVGSIVTSDLKSCPDAVIVVGTSLSVPGVRRIVREMCDAVHNGPHGVAVWINPLPPPGGKDFAGCWDVVVKGASDEVARHSALDGEQLSDVSGDSTNREAEGANEVSSEIETRKRPAKSVKKYDGKSLTEIMDWLTKRKPASS